MAILIKQSTSGRKYDQSCKRENEAREERKELQREARVHTRNRLGHLKKVEASRIEILLRRQKTLNFQVFKKKKLKFTPCADDRFISFFSVTISPQEIFIRGTFVPLVRCLLLLYILPLSSGDLAYDYSALATYHATSTSDTTSCYTWYFDAGPLTIPPLVLPPNSTISARVWVIDPFTASSNELLGAALQPSSSSGQVTRLFANLGEKPVVSFFNNPAMPSSLTPTYNSSGAFWYYTLPTPTVGGLIPTSVTGRDIYILGCTTSDRSLPLYIKKYTEAEQYFTILYDTVTGTDFPIEPPVSPYPMLRTDACASNVEVLLLNTTHFVFTQSAFTQDSQLVTFSDSNLSPFLDILPMRNGTLVLTPSSLYYLPAYPSTPSVNSVQGLPDSITHVHSSANCDCLLGSEGEVSALNFIVFAWGDSATTTVYVSVDDGQTFSALSIGVSASSSAGWTILDATLSHSYPRYIIAVSDPTDGSGTLLLYDYKYLSWSTGAPLPAALVNSDFSMEIPVTGAGTLFAWVDGGVAQDVYYSADGGGTLFPTATVPSLNTSTLLSFDTSFFGSFAVLTSNTSSQTLVRELVDVLIYSESPPPTTSPVQVDFDPFGDPRVITITSLGVTSTSSSLTLPLSSLSPCPFLHMETNGTLMNYIDMGESFAMSVTLVSAATADAYVATRDSGEPAVSIAVSDTSILDFNISLLGSSPYNPPITFSQVIGVMELSATYSSYTERSQLATGSTDIRITAKEYNAQCSFTQFIYRVRVGCPPNRRIVISSPSEGSCTSISRDVNCAVQHYYGQAFTPLIYLFDDDTYVDGTQVIADYIVWEAYGRTDYTFSQDVHSVGCISNPQKRSDFTETRLPDGTIDLSWSPATYHSCLEPGPPVRTGGAYQVLNNLTGNSVVFLGGGIYVLRMRVVASDYSYCDLTSDIVVNVYGAPLPTGYSAMIVLLTSLLIVIVLGITYYYYRHNEKLHSE